ncbi:hypothetical protein HUJ05_011506 [Dendroctonus ponderosae]|nr:hypothetical protein HUJ05_011506 [Dendroctonus ponderosae]
MAIVLDHSVYINELKGLFYCQDIIKSLQDGKTDIVCYYASWAVYRVNQGQFTTDKIDPTLCTKIVYSFAGLNIDLQVASIDNNADITLEEQSVCVAGKWASQRQAHLRRSHLRTLLQFA